MHDQASSIVTADMSIVSESPRKAWLKLYFSIRNGKKSPSHLANLEALFLVCFLGLESAF